jgi:lysozyme
MQPHARAVPWLVRAAAVLCMVFSGIVCAQATAPPLAASEPAAPWVPEAARALWHDAEQAVLLAEPMQVQLNKTELREGEPIVITVQLPQAGYLNVVAIGPDGVPTVLFPNRFVRDNRVRSGAFVIPPDGAAYQVKARPPYGPTHIAVFLSQDPVDLYATGERIGEVGAAAMSAFAQLSQAGRALLGRLGAKSFSLPAQAASLRAGKAVAQVCAASGPCGDAASDTPIDLPDAITPGILLEPEDKSPAPRALRPVADKGLRLTKLSEGFVPRLYNDAARFCTIGYGHLIKRSPCNRSEPQEFRNGISEPAGGRLLVTDMARAQRAVMALVKTPLTDGQFAALCDFAYNVGAGNLQRSTLLKVVNANEMHRVPAQLRRWTRAGGKELRGLKVRRERELALFFEGASIPKAVAPGEVQTPLDIRAGEPDTH